MARVKQTRGLPSDWPLRAVQISHGLSPARPLSGGCTHYALPEPPMYNLHAAIEVGIVATGKEERIFSDTVLAAEAGDVWLTPSWEPHAGHILVPNTTEVLLLFLPGFLGDEMLAGIPWLGLFAVPPSRRPRVTSDAPRAQVLAIASELQEELGAKSLGWEAAVRYNLLRLLLALRRSWEPPTDTRPPGEAAATDLVRLMPALNALHTPPWGRLSLAQAAAECGLSQSRFAVLFRRTMGLSFGQFALRSRVTHAAQQLRATNRSVEDVAASLGFASGSHLHRLFRRYHGLTPAAYRRQSR